MLFMDGGNNGIILPAGGDAEARWGDIPQAILYLFILLYLFMGVSLVTDKFMCAIEKVTSKKKIVKRKDGKEVTVRVWNATVANLSLMALGSSAPEILLSVIELLSNQMFSGELGPSTIVGSAAFNLLVITAICISALPDGEVRRIREIDVFIVTASFSVFAYIWLLIIIMGHTPDVIDIPEGAITFFLFFILISVAFAVDIGYFRKLGSKAGKPQRGTLRLSQESTDVEVRHMEQMVREKYGKDGKPLTEAQTAELMGWEYAQPQSRATHRIKATRTMFRAHKGYEDNNGAVNSVTLSRKAIYAPTLDFVSQRYALISSKGSVVVVVQRRGGDHSSSVPLKVEYKTRDGTAKADQHYQGTWGTLEFGPNQTEKEVTIELAQSRKSAAAMELGKRTDEPKNLEFYVDLKQNSSEHFSLGDSRTTVVEIIDDVKSTKTKIRFEHEKVHIPASTVDIIKNIKVKRIGEPTPRVTCKVYTEEDSATKDRDYKDIQDMELVFLENQLEAEIELYIMKQAKGEGDEKFRLYIKDVQNAQIDESTDGGKDCNICTVYIDAAGHGDHLYKAMQTLGLNFDQISVGNENWKEQFVTAFYVNGEPGAPAGCVDVAIHFISLPWKLFAACIPPADYCGGWLCFCMALVFIGIITAVIGDAANVLGCAVGLSAPTTAITIVALGTSLPDTMASRTAALQDPTADNCIGNVTGSNSVNVFLGLGLPWLIGAIYWTLYTATPGDRWYEKGVEANWPSYITEDYPQGAFVVLRGSLGVSVALFTGCSVVCLAFLIYRRKFCGGELGGRKRSANISSLFLVSLWFIYLAGAITYDECCASD